MEVQSENMLLDLAHAQDYDELLPYTQPPSNSLLYARPALNLGLLGETWTPSSHEVHHGYQVGFREQASVEPEFLDDPWTNSPFTVQQHCQIDLGGPSFAEPRDENVEGSWHPSSLMDHNPSSPQSLSTLQEPQLATTRSNTVDIPQSVANEIRDLPPPSNPPTKEDWQAYRPIFTQLYSTQNIKLNEVIAIMRAKYNFKATRRMFNSRITQWKLNKNYKAHEKTEMAHILKFYELKKERCPKRITVGCQPLKMDRIRRHCKNTYLPYRRLLELQSLDESLREDKASEIRLEDLRRRLVVSSKPKKPLTMPPQLGLQEQLLFSTDTLCESFIQLTIEKENNGDASSNDSTEGKDVFNKFYTAFNLLEGSQHKAAWRLINEASDMVELLFSSLDPGLVKFLLEYAIDWAFRAQPDLYGVIWRHISNIACTKLGEKHPLSTLCCAITMIQFGWEFYENTFQLLISRFSRSLSPNHDQTLDIQHSYAFLLRKNGDIDKAEQLQRLVLAQYESADKYSFNTVWALYQLSWTLYDKGDLVEAEDISRDHVQRCRIRSGEDFPDLEVDIKAIQMLTYILADRGKFAESQLLLEEALETCINREEWGLNHWLTLDVLVDLNTNLQDQGKMKEAERLRVEYSDAFD